VGPVATRSRPENDSGVDLPETRYTKTVDGLSIAYQVLGRGPVDLVLTPGWISNVDAAWDVPPLRSFFRQLASISRLILFDRRGSGLSDRPTQVESLALEHGVDDQIAGTSTGSESSWAKRAQRIWSAPESPRKSTRPQGDVASTRRPNDATMRSITWRTG
jgi:pimeloyl-ACP methyl ester carboxylesterase